MIIYKCKICGGQLDIQEGDKLTTCPYCGSIQTIPNLEDEKINRLFERGNELIINCQFDDAINKFEEILSLRNDDPEVYWSLLMAKFGVIYEKDPYTGNMLPTIHRNQDTSIYLDEDYKLTIKYADNTQLDYYNKQAKIIDNIQKKYNTIADKEEPFDIFICYKQTDDNTKLDTEDYKIAYDLYNALTNEGYKVFFSHITLEDKIGEEYEPYIYSALKSSKVLLAIGTKQEYYNAIWVKNEWSRFMYMMRNDHSKRIIPICTNTSILPNEFNKYQAIQIDNNIVWKEDLIRNIEKMFCYYQPEDKLSAINNDSKGKAYELETNDNKVKDDSIISKISSLVRIILIVAIIICFIAVVFNNKSKNEKSNHNDISSYDETVNVYDDNDDIKTNTINFREIYSPYALSYGYSFTCDVISEKEIVILVGDELMNDMLEKSYGQTDEDGWHTGNSSFELYESEYDWCMNLCWFESGKLDESTKDFGIDMIQIDGGYAIYCGPEIFNNWDMSLEKNQEYIVKSLYSYPGDGYVTCSPLYEEYIYG